LVLAWHTKGYPFRRTFLVGLVAATLLTFGRGGWIIAIMGIVLPALVARIGKIGAFVVLTPPTLAAAIALADDGESATHSEGLLVALSAGVKSIWGFGFGGFGNYVASHGRNVGSESLAGIAIHAFGVTAVVCLVVLSFRLVVLVRPRGPWEPALGIGVLLAAVFSESAGAPSGSLIAWLAIGVALRQGHAMTTQDLGGVKGDGPGSDGSMGRTLGSNRRRERASRRAGPPTTYRRERGATHWAPP
jgi:hypothetical protein